MLHDDTEGVATKSQTVEECASDPARRWCAARIFSLSMKNSDRDEVSAWAAVGVELARLEKSETITTGIAGLDEVLRGGLPPSNLYMLQGAPGAGKTTAALQFLRAGVEVGERCIYVSLSQTAAN